MSEKDLRCSECKAMYHHTIQCSLRDVPLPVWPMYTQPEVDALLSAQLATIAKLENHILDIQAHATPFGGLPEDPEYVGIYLLTAGALHRALGTIGHTVRPCETCQSASALKATIAKAVGELESTNSTYEDEWGHTCIGDELVSRAEVLQAIEEAGK